MTANEVYQRTPESVSFSLNELRISDGAQGSPMPELFSSFHWFPEPYDDDYNPETANKRVEIRILKDFNFVGRRGWKLFTIWFDGQPVMICQAAGRELDDHQARYITDKSRFIEMMNYVKSLLPFDDTQLDDDVIESDVDMPELSNFYNCTLDGKFKSY
jgi:hypothetical protein